MAMLHFLYNVAINLYTAGIWAFSFFNVKAKLWRQGRQQWSKQLSALMLPLRQSKTPVIWVHCASLGEFEQGRPLIEAIKREYAQQYAIVLSFFSPSGYEIRKNYALADVVTYLPADTPGNARKFLDIVQPAVAVFVKYEIWYNYLLQTQKAGIPLLLIAARFRPDQAFFRWYGVLFRKALHFFERIYVQNEASVDLLRQINVLHCTLSGDTRVDRVLQLAAQARDFPLVADFAGQSPLLIAGSTWPGDIAVLTPFFVQTLPENWKVIIAPHQIDSAHIQSLENTLPGPALRYSQALGARPQDFRFLIIDNIGMLSQLYRYARIAFIGGGFGTGIHNTLEPAAFLLPVIFGPRYHKFDEALDMVQEGAFFSVKNTSELSVVFQQLENSETYAACVEKVKNYLHERKGATEIIMAGSFRQLGENAG